MVILVAGWRGAVFTVAEEAWSGFMETLETTDDTVERSTAGGLENWMEITGKQSLTLTFLWQGVQLRSSIAHQIEFTKMQISSVMRKLGVLICRGSLLHGS